MTPDRFHGALRAALITASLALATADSTPNGWVCASAVIVASLVSRRRVEREGRAWSPASVTLLVLAVTAGAIGEYYFLRVPLILVLGHYMTAVQAARLMERKKNRDQAQLLLLSALVMVIAAVLSSSVSYAVFLMLYLYFGTGAVLLMHLKRESERRRDAMIWCDLDADYIRRTDLHARSETEPPLRRFALRTAVAVLVVGAAVSLAMPRGMGGFLGDWQARPGSRTGFDETVDFSRGGRVEQDDTVVMHVRFSDPITGETLRLEDDAILLRGATQEHFNGVVWSTPWPGPTGRRVRTTDETRKELGRLDAVVGRNLLRQEITLFNAQGANLFTLYPPVRLELLPNTQVGLDRFDLTLRCSDGLRGTHRYIIDSVRRGRVASLAGEIDRLAAEARTPAGNLIRYRPGEYASRFRSNDDFPERDHAVRIQPTRNRRAEPPSVAAARNNEAKDRLTELARSIVAEATARAGRPLTKYEQVAAVERRLRTEFQYAPDPPEQLSTGGQPMMDFLFLYRQGNCQFFAAAMVMLCRTTAVDVPARLVTGFRGGEYNDAGGFYIVRARDAHAWVEVYLPGEGWVAFDPTPAASAHSEGFWLWRKVREIYNYLDFHWGELVLSYNKPQRDSAASGAVGWIASWVGKALPPGLFSLEGQSFGRLLSADRLDQLATLVMAGILLVGGGWWLLRRGRTTAGGRTLRRRPAAPLPAPPPAPSVPQYESLMAALTELGVAKLPQATPMAFARALAASWAGLSNLPRLIERLYYARYSGRTLSDQDQAALARFEAEIRRMARMV